MFCCSRTPVHHRPVTPSVPRPPFPVHATKAGKHPLSRPHQLLAPRMAEPQHQKERERRRLTKRITNTTNTNTAVQTPATPFSARRTSVNSTDVAYSAVHNHRPSSSRTNFTAAAAAASAAAAGGAGRLSLTQADELVGNPFDSQKLLKDLDNTTSHIAPNVYQPVTAPITNSRSSIATFIPTPLSHSKTFDERLLSPKLRASQSFAALGAATKMERISPPRSEKSDPVSPRQRYSDEARPDGKKKSMFANLLNGVKSNPRRPTISTPSNPMHVTHVGIDNETGKFTVRTLSTQ